MKIGTISGKVTYLRKAPGLAGEQFWLVDTRTEQLVAADLVGAAVGDRVLLVTGHEAARLSLDTPMDAAVVAILEE